MLTDGDFPADDMEESNKKCEEGEEENKEKLENKTDKEENKVEGERMDVLDEDSKEKDSLPKYNGLGKENMPNESDRVEKNTDIEHMDIVENSNDTDTLEKGNSEDALESAVSEDDITDKEDKTGKNVHCSMELPDGWSRKTVSRINGNSSGVVDTYYYSPDGKRLRSINEVKAHCAKNNLDIDFNKYFVKKRNPSRETNGQSNSNSPAPDNLKSVSPSMSNSIMSTDPNSDSQTSSESPTPSSVKAPEKKLISTSALLRAYRPHPKTAGRSANKSQSNSTTNQSSKNSTGTSQQKRKATTDLTEGNNMSDTSSGLVMECKSDTLTFAQVTKIQKLKDDLSKLQLLLYYGSQEGDKNGTPPLMNGTVGDSPPTSQPLTNGTSLVGLQVPQFLLLQNGQMLGSSSITSNSQTVTNSETSATVSNSLSSVTQNSFSSSTAKSSTSKSSQEGNNKKAAPSNSSRSSPDIQVLKEMRMPTHVQGTPSTGPSPSTSGSSSSTTGAGKSFPLLSIVCRPKNNLPPSVAMGQRKDLDAKVKSVLVKSAQEFVEWLLSEGLIRTSQFCTIHKLQPSQMPYKLKLGMFSDPKVLSTSGGYVWISECCGKKYVSVYSGSIFGSTPIDKVAPTAVLKLIYHWSCQTSVPNVESWVKVDKTFINKIFNYLRCVCSVMLQDKVYDFGFDGTTVELGIVSLGTSTADGTKKAVKVEILGLYDRKMKSYRLFASEPEPGSSSRQRFVRILKPLERVVHTNAILLCDQSVDRNCLYNMNYGKVSVCETSDNEENLQSNAKIMSYLRRHVPKMFQSTLSQLTLQQVQVVLDELCWRERFGHCAAHSFNTMMEHITYLTAREAENPGVLHLLDFVSQKPQHNWRYKSQHMPKVLPALQPSIIMSTPTAGTINPQVTMDIPTGTQSPLDHTNKVALTPRRGPTSRDVPQTVPIPQPLPSATVAPKPDAVELEPFYYGQIQGDSSLGREVNNYSYTCHLCNDTINHNIEFYTHLKGHVGRRIPSQKYCCDYCIEHFDSQESRDYHQKFRHLQMDTRFTWCRICTESFPGEFQLVNHMAKKHYESELPYRCEVCNFTTSIYFSIINHFKIEHKDSPYVQCHYCLSVKTINSSSASSFSFRMLQHLQKHTSQQGKCKSCSLSFYSKYLLDEHKKKDHVSRSMVAGLQRYKVPAGHNRIMFRPWVKRGASSSSQLVQMQASNTVAISSTLQRLDSLAIDVGEEDRKYYCIECDASLTLDQHYKAYQKCTKCAYSTCCRNMISKHAQVFHPNGKTKSGYYRIGPPILLPQPLYCICGFSTCSGNHLARHLALCEGGRKSAYPSMMDAMVYRGDPMTPSALALSTLGLTRMLPGSVTPTPPSHESGDPPIDMSHFMSMSMDVDDENEDDPPIMPLSVELKD